MITRPNLLLMKFDLRLENLDLLSTLLSLGFFIPSRSLSVFPHFFLLYKSLSIRIRAHPLSPLSPALANPERSQNLTLREWKCNIESLRSLGGCWISHKPSNLTTHPTRFYLTTARDSYLQDQTVGGKSPPAPPPLGTSSPTEKGII